MNSLQTHEIIRGRGLSNYQKGRVQKLALDYLSAKRKKSQEQPYLGELKNFGVEVQVARIA
jgi:hypothetical protein